MLMRYVELIHSAQIKAKAEKANEITILATPCLELGHDERLNDYEPTNNYEQTNKDEPLNKKPNKQQSIFGSAKCNYSARGKKNTSFLLLQARFKLQMMPR